jgi:hypothetical protein
MRRATMAGALTVMMSTGAVADEWTKAVRKYIDAGVRPTRACGQHTGTCTNAISDGNYMLIAVEGRDGRIAARLVCEFNQFRDRRSCVNFDTGARHVEVFANGRWVDAQ